MISGVSRPVDVRVVTAPHLREDLSTAWKGTTPFHPAILDLLLTDGEED